MSRPPDEDRELERDEGFLRGVTAAVLGGLRALPRGLLARLRAAAGIYEGIAIAPYRSAIQRRYRDQRDAFLLATFADALGVPNPVEFYTLELLPDLMDEFHDWHRRAGLERAPEGGWRCC